MTEFISKKRAADWGIINDALVAGTRAINKAKFHHDKKGGKK